MASNNHFTTVGLKSTACTINAAGMGKKAAHSPRHCPEEMVETGTKRKADMSLAKQEIGAKRFALGNLTNAEATGASSTIGAVLKSKVSNFLSKPMLSNKSAVDLTKASWKPNEQHFKKNKAPKIHGVPRIMTRAAMRKQQAVEIDQKLQHEKPISISKGKENFSSSTDVAGVTAYNNGQRKGDEAIAGKPKPLASVATNRSSWKNVLRTRSTVESTITAVSEHGVVNGEQQKKHQPLVVPVRTDVKPKRGRASNEFEASDNSLYVSAVECLEEASCSSTSTGTENIVQSKAQPGRPELKPKRGRGSSEFEDSSSLYVTAVESLDDGAVSKGKAGEQDVQSVAFPVPAPSHIPVRKTRANGAGTEQENAPWKMSITENVALTRAATAEIGAPRKQPPPGVEDYDLCYWNDIYQVSEYAQDIFDYLQEREPAYCVPDYIAGQKHLTKRMRALLVDWMIEIQETFELNHETLYLAVKILDTYLSRVKIGHDLLQLVGIAGMLIASKYDERLPPTVDDFVYFCDGAYDRTDLLKMERTVFRTIGFDLGFPLSYRFLRRYARVNRIPMMTLTLARYILETGLMDYNTVLVRDSLLACAALFIARRMLNQPGWNETLEHYSGYKVEQFKDAVILLNDGIRSRQYSFETVHKKYSHELFFEVAKCPVITSMAQMFGTCNVVFKVPDAPSSADPSATTASSNTSNVPSAKGAVAGSNNNIASNVAKK
uniref:Uncharacterized protein n=1 Tax=Anopheles farauti TaxID=69004 RepID=A0A182QEQ4_9DIPT